MSQETVVDRVIKYLVEDLYVPMDMIDTNVALSEFDVDSDITIDIVVNVKDKDDYFVPVMVIRCLDDDIALEGEVLEKQLEILEEIDNVTLSGRAVLTNGDEMFFGEWTGREYSTDSQLPNYEVMVNDFIESEKEAEKFLEEGHSCCDHDHEHGECCDHDHGHEH